ncbi:membrane-bound PQQ-dependent dehydrogenase, glucose/quinate/shikimate family [Croceicoccus sediminis]|uniref:membrane-bound PQQ-dependent dehydrogenase, glucose/quinate/shikimate family n=1 Tax=Croceicoccus sediminis TaxID=2571150 RepID=UPI0011844248|nr:membrane-bound PQQ-dependent dehydrogenase, glucose/quinate/shikimate family [Croceicoccus sediminis]
MAIGESAGGTGRRPPLWARLLAAAFLGVVGIALLGGGAWLISLGGSAYYALAGAACLAAGVLLLRGDRRALPIYAALLVGTLVWAVWEVGLTFWQLVPRVAGPLVIGVILALPFVQRALVVRRSRTSALLPAIAAGASAVVMAVAFLQLQPYDVAPNGNRVAAAVAEDGPTDWTAYGSNAAGLRHSGADQITPANVANLQSAWTFRTGDTAESRPDIGVPMSFMATPLMVDDTVYFCSPTGKVFALDADTGKPVWTRDPRADIGNAQMLNCRGVSYHADAQGAGLCSARILSMTVDGRLLASDARTGKPCPDFGKDGSIDLTQGLGSIDPLRSYTSSPPAIIGDVAVLGSYVRDNFDKDDPSGVVRAFDVKSGRMLWGWDSGRPDDALQPAAGEEWTRGSPNAWSVFSADPELGLVYLPTGNATPDHVGTHRSPGLERYASSIVALDVATGKVRWSFQTVHHDIWDYDVPAQPVLFDYPSSDGPVPALAAPTKQGEIFILDRRTGKPLIEVEERSVPQGNLPGERYSPTQPFNKDFASFAPPKLTEASMWGATPLDQLYCRIRFRSLDYKGLYTPPSERGMVQYPGTFGTLNWGSVSIDTARGLMIVNSAAIPQEVLLFPRDGDAETPEEATSSHAPGYLPQIGTDYGVSLWPMLSPLGIPCTAPPWGHLSAVDLKTGKLAWQRTIGTSEDVAPLGIRIPGAFNLGGSVTTKTGLTFIGATIDDYLRAFDTETGAELWKGRLPAGGQATPITYRSAKTGRQYVVIAAGGHMYMGSTPGDHVVAFALP